MRIRLAFQKDPARVVFVLALLTLGIWSLFFASRGFFSGDSGMKLAQAHALQESSFTSRALPYDWDLDPAGTYFPYGDLVVEVDGERQGIYSWVFTGATVPFIAAFGIHGIVVLPLLGGLLIGWGVFRLSRRSGLGPFATSAAVLVVLFLTPVLFYSSQYAEHSLAAGLVVLAASFAVGSVHDADGPARPAVAGILVGLAATVRPEAYCAVASLGVALALQGGVSVRERVRASAWFLGGCVPVLVVFWGVNYVSAGTWDLAFNRNKGRSASLHGAFTMLFGEVKRAKPWTWWCVLLAAASAGLVPAGLLRRWRWVPHAIAGVMLCWLAWSAHAHASGRTLVGLFSVSPLVAYGLLAGPWNPRTRVAWILAVTFVLQVLLFDKSGTAGGLQFGARFLLPALPVLVVLAAVVAQEHWRSGTARFAQAGALAPVVVLVVLTALFMGRGFTTVNKIASNGWEATERAIDASPSVIVTRRWWESQVLAPAILEGKKIYNAPRPRPLVQRLADRGVLEFVHISKANTNIPLSNRRVARTERVWPGWLHVQHVVIEPR